MASIPGTQRDSRVALRNVLRQMGTLVGVAAVLSACAFADPPITAGADAGVPDAALPTPDATNVPDAAPAPDADTQPAKRVVILMIGDGMGPGQLEAASYFANGAPGLLALENLPVRGKLRTASLSGITDSAASATMMATGVKTFNGRVGIDRGGQPVQTLVELAKLQGLATGVVSTSTVTHATPGSFTAHRMTRDDHVGIADDQATVVQPDVLLGGGAQYFRPAGEGSERDDDGLLDDLGAAGYLVVTTDSELMALEPETDKVVGLFADEHMDYVLDRGADTTQPTLQTMARRALDILDRNPDGFFLVIEGSRIDMAGHGNDLPRTVGETVAFDQTVQAVQAWAQGRTDVTVVVTADHETGGLTVEEPSAKGVLPQVSWRWGNHTNAHVSVTGFGPGTDLFHDAILDHAWVHAALAARIEGRDLTPPPTVLTPDGHLGDLPHEAAVQVNDTGFGEGFNQLDALHLGADRYGMGLGIAGAFEWDKNAVVVLIDVDYGAGTGVADLAGAISDATGTADTVLAELQLTAPPAPGFGADLALVVFGGQDPHLEDLESATGLRGLRAPYGTAANLGWFGTAINFAPGTRARHAPAITHPDRGLEAHIPWSTLYPGLDGAVPPGATIAVTAVVVNDDGGYTSNQMLPPLASATPNPGRNLIALPGVTVFTVDADDDGVADGTAAPTCVP